MAVTTCIHGFPPGQCLICQTLQGSKEQTRPRAGPAAPTTRPTPVRPDAVVTERRPVHRSLGLRAAGLVLVIALVVLAAGWIIGLAFTVLRTLELIAAAAAAGWVGYRVGLYRGQHQGVRR